ncbi:hypothetical protein TrST_g5017 [Triparma strigata]|uniref:Uncharacterized protein n=1 Tax=Triparma strigata TaxID=1606541 RepID=A0A9W7F2I5_9STRA|nr:hypothetical protein TrST_g5017 [Triparma strigata]
MSSKTLPLKVIHQPSRGHFTSCSETASRWASRWSSSTSSFRLNVLVPKQVSSSSFAGLRLQRRFQDACKKLGYNAPTPVQQQSVGPIVDGLNIVAQAPTGTGKTFAFALPIIQSLSKSIDEREEERSDEDQLRDQLKTGRSYVKTLILSPTRELALQTCDVFEDVCRAAGIANLKIRCVHGGVSVNTQLKSLQHSTDVLIATPGRLLDILDKNGLKYGLMNVTTVVLDEADKLLSPGFDKETTAVINRLTNKAQMLAFSATFPFAIRPVVHSLMGEDEYVRIGEVGDFGLKANATKTEEKTTSTNLPLINLKPYRINEVKKLKFLRNLILSKEKDYNKILVFVKTKKMTEEVAKMLRMENIKAVGLNGDLSQGARSDRLYSFKMSDTRVLVATDVAARGLDVKKLNAVVNYDLPRSPSDFVHRIGRVGRAGVEGDAVTLVTEENEEHYYVVCKKNGLGKDLEEVPGFEVDEDEWKSKKEKMLEQGLDLHSGGNGGVKGRKKSKKDKLREAARREAAE